MPTEIVPDNTSSRGDQAATNTVLTTAGAPAVASPIRPIPLRQSRWSYALALLLVLLGATFLRAVNFPHRYEVRDMDEVGYLENGLNLWEGVTPAIRVAPAAPQTWITWCYAAGKTAVEARRLSKVRGGMPMEVRPFFAVNDALFDIYQDMSGLRQVLLSISLIVGVGGVLGAFVFGSRYGGWVGGVIVGGLVAALPVYIEFVAMSRPYSDAWSFTWMALGATAVLRGRRRCWVVGITYALAVASRIDMLSLLPVLAWLYWDNPDSARTFRWLAKMLLLAGTIVLLISPWLLMSPLGVLRTIVTTRGAQWAVVENGRLLTIRELLWEQGLGPAMLLAGLLFLAPAHQRVRQWVLLILVAMLVATMFSGPYQPLRYHGGPIIAMLSLIGVAAGNGLQRRNGTGATAVALLAIALVLPVVQATRFLLAVRRSWAPADATGWVEQHVPAGSIVYDAVTYALRCPLPTPAAADAGWDEVSNASAWRRKFKRGLSRFGIDFDQLPRALSEDNLVLDRGAWRRYFILGSPQQPQRPRFDLRPYNLGLFGVQDVAAQWARTGGVVICRDGLPLPALGKPIAQWTNASGRGTFIYCSPDVAAKLKE